MNIRKEMMELEVSERILALKIHKKELTLNRLSQLVDDADHCRVCSSGSSSNSCSSSSSSSSSAIVVVFKPFFCFDQLLYTQIEGDVGMVTWFYCCSIQHLFVVK